MTDARTPHRAVCAAVRRQDGAEGALLVVFLNARRDIVLTVEIGEGTDQVDELFLRHLVAIVTDLGVAEVIFAITRESGRPTRIDKLLWRELSTRLVGTSTSLAEVMVVGQDSWWSAATGRAQSLARTSADAR
jgi:DNA repair protein RadC